MTSWNSSRRAVERSPVAAAAPVLAADDQTDSATFRQAHGTYVIAVKTVMRCRVA